MAVVVLKEGIAAVVVGVETLSIFCAFHTAYLVKLDHRVVAAPGPDSGGIILGSLPTAAYHVVFNEAAVTAPWPDAVTADIFEQISAYHDIKAGEPVV